MADFFVVAMVGNAKRWQVDVTQFPIINRINNTLSTLPEFIVAEPFSQSDCPDDLKRK